MKDKIKSLFFTENQRNIVIISTIYIENLLEELLLKKCVDDEKKDELVKNNGPISTLYNKILISYSFGLITEVIYTYLEIIRKVRNDCAHDLNVADNFHINLSSQKNIEIVKKMMIKNLNKLVKDKKDKNEMKKFSDLLNKNLGPTESPLFYFYMILSIIDYLDTKISETEKNNKPRHFDLKYINFYLNNSELEKIVRAHNLLRNKN